MNDNSNIKIKNNKYVKIGLIAGIIIIIGFIGLNIFTKKSLYNGKIAQNIFIENIDVSNMTKAEAIKVVDSKYKPSNLNLVYKDKNYEVDYKNIELKYNIEEVVNKAYNATRTGSYFNDIKSYINIKSSGEKYSINSIYNEDKLDKCLDEVANQINKKSKDATVSLRNGISVIGSENGLKFIKKENKKLVTQALNNKDYEDINLKVKVTEPKIKTEDVRPINTMLASFSTTFNESKVERSFNIGLAAQRSNNVILLPGETFSYNKQTGPRVLSNGFLSASVIVAGEYADAPGGGVCQTSTTLFNAALLSGLKIDSVRNHSKTSSYVPRGRDAMVNDSGSDLRFTNNFDHAVYIQCYRSGSSVNAAVYGASQDKVKVSIKVDNFTYNGLPGAKTYRTITKNGQSKTSHIYTSVYQE